MACSQRKRQKTEPETFRRGEAVVLRVLLCFTHMARSLKSRLICCPPVHTRHVFLRDGRQALLISCCPNMCWGSYNSLYLSPAPLPLSHFLVCVFKHPSPPPPSPPVVSLLCVSVCVYCVCFHISGLFRSVTVRFKCTNMIAFILQQQPVTSCFVSVQHG